MTQQGAGKGKSGGRPPRESFLSQVSRLAGPYWDSPHRWRIRGVTALLALLTVAQVGLAVWTNYWNRALFDALEQRAIGEVLLQVGVFVLIFALTVGVTAAHLMVKRWLQLDWRAWLTDQLIGRWMEDGRHYRLLYRRGEHDNPDGRIAEDIRIATETAIALAHTLLYSLLILGLFIDILWTVSGSLQLPGMEIAIPGYLVPLAFLYAGVGALLGWSFGQPLVRATNALQTAEADFRFGLARAREHSEAIALMHGEAMERTGTRQRFSRILRDWHRQSRAYMGIVGFSTGYGALLPVFPIMVAAPQYILGMMSLGLLMQAAQAFQKLTSALSWPIDSLGEIARTRASAERVLSLWEDMQRMDRDAREPDSHRIELKQGASSRLVVDALSIADPSGQILLEDFSCRIDRGERVLVTGDPAVTSSLFKVIGGLWPWGTGHVQLPSREAVFFMPQRPFLPEGTLRASICYPRAPDAFATAQIARALECAGVAWLTPRLDDEENWEQVLPLRAQQRLGFARALLQRPQWLFMEEATDAFDPRSEQRILEMLHRELPDSGMLTISFHPGLEGLHHRKIVLNRLGETRWLFDRRHPGRSGPAH
jgi:putative ATP-binding cassette transporter